jgi:FAD:protein FMN transferase
MRHVSRPARFATACAAACLLPLAAGCAAVPADAVRGTSARSGGCRDLTPDRPPGATRHLHDERTLMGTSFQIRVVTRDADRGCEAIDAAFSEVARQEALFSEYRESSEVSAINRNAGRMPVEVDPEVFGLLQRSAAISRVTGGAFDVTFAGCGRLWSVREQRIPDDESLAACMEHVGYARVQLDDRRAAVLLPDAGMRIGLGGIAKGYGVDRAADVLAARGMSSFVVDGGGDMRIEGRDVEGPWTVHIAHPRRTDEVFDTIQLSHGSIVTSGDYLRYFERDGVRYHHILDPATGRPARRSVSVTVIAPTATEADGLATGLFVLGPERGLAVAAALPGVSVLYFAPDLSVHASPGFPRGLRAASQGPAPSPETP